MFKQKFKHQLYLGFFAKTLLFISCCLLPQLMFGIVKLPKLVGDNMVLQRNVNLPIWGTAAVGENVTVTFNGQTHSTVTPASGKWRITLTPLTAGGPFTMSVQGSNTITLTNVLIGDVYLASGQSNMELEFDYGTASSFYADEIATSSNSNIRQFKVSKSVIAATDDVSATPYGWQSAAPANMRHFSMVAYFFARDLYSKYGVPIGIINSTYGGTIIEAWISHEGLINFPDLYNQSPPSIADTNPSILHNAMISPLLNCKFKGVLWYQGESNVSNAFEYRNLFPALIEDFRTKFNEPNLPFLYVQLANYSGVTEPQQTSQIAELREAQALAQTIGNTAMVVSHETGLSGVDIHPIWKLPIALRLSAAAQNRIYGETNIAYVSPSYQSSVVSGNKMIVTFKNVGTGLNKVGSVLNQFTIAGADKVYKTATATIIGTNTVEVSAATVASPMYVRYAWADNPRNANLYNSFYLPAESFRSDQPSESVSYTAMPFTNGNLVVTRYGDGNALPATDTTVPIFLDEYSSAGAKRNVNRPMPNIAGNYGAGISNLISGRHSFGVEALLSLSENKKFLAFAANNMTVGLPVNAVGSKTIAVLAADGALNTNTTANWGVARMATVSNDLSRVYYISQTQGLSFVPYQSTGANVVLAAGENGYRSAAIYNGQLYVSTGTSPTTQNYAEVTRQVSTVGAGMPTANTQTLMPLPGLPTNEIVRQFIFLSTTGNNNYDLFYGVTESNKLIKYKLVSGTWVAKGSVTVGSVVSLTGKMDGANAILYSTTLNSSNFASTLVKIEDPAASNSTLSTNVVNVIATAATNTYFKGVAFAPENSDISTLPVELNNFEGAMNMQGVKLNWETSQERNAAYFEVWRADDGVAFRNIGSVKAAGNSDIKKTYSFTDFNPAQGINYYQLKQVDLDGKSAPSKIVAVNSGLVSNIFKVAQTSATNLTLTITAVRHSLTNLTITNMMGQKVYDGKVVLNNGLNSLQITPINLLTGIYILQAVVDGKNNNIKFYLNQQF
ncbi:sialate O-acetylesterase [Pedobacter xixiisoli]|nr:sialate O-acetylesterase [Pedobacter xixiisoli]